MPCAERQRDNGYLPGTRGTLLLMRVAAAAPIPIPTPAISPENHIGISCYSTSTPPTRTDLMRTVPTRPDPTRPGPDPASYLPKRVYLFLAVFRCRQQLFVLRLSRFPLLTCGVVPFAAETAAVAATAVAAAAVPATPLRRIPFHLPLSNLGWAWVPRRGRGRWQGVTSLGSIIFWLWFSSVCLGWVGSLVHRVSCVAFGVARKQETRLQFPPSPSSSSSSSLCAL